MKNFGGEYGSWGDSIRVVIEKGVVGLGVGFCSGISEVVWFGEFDITVNLKNFEGKRS